MIDFFALRNSCLIIRFVLSDSSCDISGVVETNFVDFNFCSSKFLISFSRVITVVNVSVVLKSLKIFLIVDTSEPDMFSSSFNLKSSEESVSVLFCNNFIRLSITSSEKFSTKMI